MQAKINFSFVASGAGLYWMEALMNDVVVTRMPVQIELVRETDQETIEAT